MTSEPRPFDYLPLDSGRPFLSFKRLKQSYGPFSRILGLDSNYLGLGDGGGDRDDEDDLRRKLPCVTVSTNIVSGTTSSGTSGGGIIGNEGPNTTLVSKEVLVTPTTSEEVKQRMSAALKRRNQPPGGVSNNNNALMVPRTGISNNNNNNKLSPIWSDLSSNCYSDAELLEDVLSDSSVNELLSGVGCDGCTVYQDLDSSLSANVGLNSAISNTLSLLNSPCQLEALLSDGVGTTGLHAVGPTSSKMASAMGAMHSDALYGDASYASCYSNLEFVMNRAKCAQQQQLNVSPSGGDGLIRGAMFPGVPDKVVCSTDGGDDEDAGIYGVPSNRPVHATKAALLHNRGFNTQQLTTSSAVDRNLLTEMDLDQDEDLLPKTVLDLFV